MPYSPPPPPLHSQTVSSQSSLSGPASQSRRLLATATSTDDFTLVAVDHNPADNPASHPPLYALSPVDSRENIATARPALDGQGMSSSHDPGNVSQGNGAPTTRHSSRRALTEALRLAQEAVLLDSQNDDPIAAFRAYARSVALLNQVMDRVMNGDREGERRPGRSRSDAGREDEARRLKSIHDTYAERMRILADIYPIPDELPPSSPVETYHPIMRPAPSNSVTVQEPHLEQQMDAMSISSDPEDSAPSTPTLSERQMGAESPDSSQESHSALRERPPSPHLNSQLVQTAGRTSFIPPARPPPTGPPPSRPRAASAAIQSHVDHNTVASPTTRDDSRLWAFTLGESSRAGGTPNHWQASPSPFGEAASPPLPPLPEPSPRASPITPRAEPRVSRGAPSPDNTPRQRAHLSRVMEEKVDRASLIDRDASGSPRLVNATTSEGTISQRRNKANSNASTALATAGTSSVPPVVKLTIPPSLRDNLSGSNRLRASSQPGLRPSPVVAYPSPSVEGPLVPSGRIGSVANIGGSGKSFHLSPLQTQGLNVGSPPYASRSSSHLPTVPTSPLPPPSPSDPVRKPYHLMALLKLTMTSKTGGYITRKLHVPHEVWSQGGAKLTSLPEKVRMIEVLCSALEELQIASTEMCGPPGGIARSSPVTKVDFERWLSKLEEWGTVCDGVVGGMAKKLGVGEGFAAKKGGTMTTWSSKFARSLDKLTNGKNLDSPASYVGGLARLFQQAQVLDEHSEALASPNATLYLNVPAESRSALEVRLKQSSEFFATVILTFVIRDLSLLLDKYAKKGGQWLSE